MLFVIFILLLFALSRFYRWEHLLFERELRQWRQTEFADDYLRQHDWRVVARPEGRICLRRAFHVRTRADLLRYAVPVIAFCVILFVLKSWIFSGLYLVVIAVKWFAAVTDVYTGTPPRYQVRISDYSLFGDTL